MVGVDRERDMAALCEGELNTFWNDKRAAVMGVVGAERFHMTIGGVSCLPWGIT
jgi:hypothetical protein